jgi:hypothetical protein
MGQTTFVPPRPKIYNARTLQTLRKTWPLKAQLRTYDDLKKVNESSKDALGFHKEKGGKFGPDAVHAMIAAGSSDERKSVATFLECFRPLRLFGVDRGNSDIPDHPRKAVLLGQHDGTGIPVVAVLQPKYIVDKKSPPDTGELKDGDVSRADLLVSGLLLLRNKGLVSVCPHLYEFDYSGTHGNVLSSSGGKTLQEELKLRGKERSQTKAEVIAIREEEHIDEVILEKRSSFVGHLVERTEELLADTRNALEEDESPKSKVPFTKSDREVPVVDDRINLHPASFRHVARCHCLHTGQGVVGPVSGSVLVNVTRNKIQIVAVAPSGEDVFGTDRN